MREIVIETIKSVRRVDKKVCSEKVNRRCGDFCCMGGSPRPGVIMRLVILEWIWSGNRRLYLSSENLSFRPEMVHSFDA